MCLRKRRLYSVRMALPSLEPPDETMEPIAAESLDLETWNRAEALKAFKQCEGRVRSRGAGSCDLLVWQKKGAWKEMSRYKLSKATTLLEPMEFPRKVLCPHTYCYHESTDLLEFVKHAANCKHRESQ